MKGIWISKRYLFAAGAILLLAASFRLIGFQEVPPGLVRDEVLNADIVEFIRNGQHALFFREGYGHEPLYHYFGVPFQILLGDNALAIRYPSFLLGMLLVALSMSWAKRLTGSTIVGLLCGLGLAIGWWPIIFSRLGLRAISLPVLLVLAHYAWIQNRPKLAAVWIGLAFYTYTAARVMLALPILLLLDAYLLQKDNRSWQGTKSSWQFASIVYILYLPLQLTLWLDPSLQQRVDQLSGVTDVALQGDLGPLWHNILATLGVFTIAGDPLWSYANANQPLFDWISGGLLVGGLLIALLKIRDRNIRFVLFWLGLGLLPTILAPEAPSLIRLIGIMPIVYLFLGMGADWLLGLSKEYGRAIVLIIPIAFGWQLSSTVLDGFVAWTQATPTLEKYGPIWRDMSADIAAYPDAEIVIADSWVDPIDHDRVVRTLGQNRPLRWSAVDQNVTSGAIVFPADANLTRFYLPEFANLNPTLAEIAGIDKPIYQSESWPTFRVYNLSDRPKISLQDQQPIFNQSIELQGWEFRPFVAEGRLEVYTVWHATKPLPYDLAAFIHLTDLETEALLAQHDGFDSFIPQLQPGDVILQRHLIWLPADINLDEVELYVGVYERTTGIRWQTDNLGVDRYFLGSR
ncbi:MAG: hypothetical protein AAGD96_05040 [Chloroflexota bacterium]